VLENEAMNLLAIILLNDCCQEKLYLLSILGEDGKTREDNKAAWHQKKKTSTDHLIS
jgi:hypothetical protein